MNPLPSPVADLAAPLLVRDVIAGSAGGNLLAVYRILPHLDRGTCVDAVALHGPVKAAFWVPVAVDVGDRKRAYAFSEAATVLLFRRYRRTLLRAAPSPVACFRLSSKSAGLLPRHTRLSEDALVRQQVPAPSPLVFAALTAAAITPADCVLEPSAGTSLHVIRPGPFGSARKLNRWTNVRLAEPVREWLRAQIPFGRFIAWKLSCLNPVDRGVLAFLARRLAMSLIARIADGSVA